MSKITVIIQREYVTRVRKKSFLIMTVLAPLLMAAIIIVPVMVMTGQEGDSKKIAIVEDGSTIFKNKIPDTDETEFVYLEDVDINVLKNNFTESGYYGVLFISPIVATVPNAVQLISRKQPPMSLIDHISNSMEKEIERQKLLSYNIENLDQILKSIRTNVSIQTIKIDEEGIVKETSTGIAMALAYLNGFLMYMLVFIFGTQVMRGVIEEKTNRVVEVLVSSVKPIELMLGKIIGIAMVGLTQFTIWIVLTVAAVFVVQTVFLDGGSVTEITQNMPQELMNSAPGIEGLQVPATADNPDLNELKTLLKSAMNLPWTRILLSFVFYFLTGYLLYASLFAAVGSAVDNETDTQQFMLPITIPIIVGLMVAMGTMENPESSVSFWFSIIPLTSPIVMMARLPFGVPNWELALSMGLMVITFIFFVWLASKIYRTGILMYGKKPTYKEMWKWIRYKG